MLQDESLIQMRKEVRQLSGLKDMNQACWAEDPGFEHLVRSPTVFKTDFSSAETQQPVDSGRRKAGGCLVLSGQCKGK